MGGSLADMSVLVQLTKTYSAHVLSIKASQNTHILCGSLAGNQQNLLSKYVMCSTEIRRNWAEVRTEKQPKNVCVYIYQYYSPVMPIARENEVP